MLASLILTKPVKFTILLNVLCVGMESVPRVISLSSKNTLLFAPAEVRMAIKSVSLRVSVCMYNRKYPYYMEIICSSITLNFQRMQLTHLAG